jgi:hypothetical protein
MLVVVSMKLGYGENRLTTDTAVVSYKLQPYPEKLDWICSATDFRCLATGHCFGSFIVAPDMVQS